MGGDGLVRKLVTQAQEHVPNAVPTVEAAGDFRRLDASTPRRLDASPSGRGPRGKDASRWLSRSGAFVLARHHRY